MTAGTSLSSQMLEERPLGRGQENGCRSLHIPHNPSFSRAALLTCMVSHRPSAPARVPVLGIILHKEEKRNLWYNA